MKARSHVLKDANIKWLVMLAVLDAAVVLLFIAPELVDASKMAILRASASPLLPVVVLLLTGLLSHEAKARLVYWRIRNPLPGSQAFTKYAPADARTDMKALARNVGALPTDPASRAVVRRGTHCESMDCWGLVRPTVRDVRDWRA
ncbi:hypothetical protein OR16_15274 [Cupriavidus basilensis OR16]|uniref:Uncharacterized protein n=1 Tax=Cupriavidus basilensis OR16 TaxID=1127483 RepID=H1S5D5_9BURK|nr:hypothetical protein [Cupriavidus basilensis]EHP42302.1 hypothetical protein OR16_15274 [Cupriavidus basilensis OR16]